MKVKSPDPKPEGGSSCFKAFQWFVTLAGLSILIGCCFAHSLDWGRETNRMDWAVASLGCCLVVFGIIVDRIPTNLSLVLGSTLFTVLVSFGGLFLLKVDPFETMDRMLLALFPPKIGIWKYDERFGYTHRPGAVGRFQKGVIDVQYQIDSEGFRVTPTPEHPLGRIVFLGCSFTFGTGVENHQPYPYVLGQKYWPDYKVRNRGVTGWGTVHAYLSLLEELEEPRPPLLVFYGWIDAHRTRNLIRKTWVEHLGRNWGLTRNLFGISDFRKHPHFEVVEGELEFQGVVGPEDLTDDPPDLREREIRVTQKFIEEMNRLCVERAIPFFVLNLPVSEGINPLEESGRIEPPDYLIETIEANRIEYLDLQPENRGRLPGDNHPSPDTHAAIAQRLASDEHIRSLIPLRDSNATDAADPTASPSEMPTP